MRNITIRVSDEMYDFFEEKRKEYNEPFLSHAFKKFFLIEEDDQQIVLNIGASDKKWVGLITLIYDLLIQAEIEVTGIKEKGAKNGYFELLNYIKNVRVMSDLVVSQFDKNNFAIDKEQASQLSDVSIFIAEVIKTCIGNQRKISKLRLKLAEFLKEEM